MSKKKNGSRAEQAAGTKQKSSGTDKGKRQSQTDTTENGATGVPKRLISAVCCLALFVVFLIMLFNTDGFLLKFLHSVVLGLIGKVGYYFLIPSLLYLFFVHAFSGKRPVMMRTICLLVFVVLCGCIAHLAGPEADLVSGFGIVTRLYVTGESGESGGVICGLVAMLLDLICARAISYIILVVAAVLTLLASFQITIPSIMRAFENRPRADWEIDEAREEKPEPAAVVVNHLANKRIEHIENRRRQQQERTDIDIPLDGEKKPKSSKHKKKKESVIKVPGFMSQIDDIDTPVAAADIPVTEEIPPIDEPYAVNQPVPEVIDVLPVESVSVEREEAKTVHQTPVAEEVPAPPVIVPELPSDKVTAKEARASAAEVAAEIAQNAEVQKPMYCFPPIDLLAKSKRGGVDGTDEMRENTRRLNETLASFKIEAHIINVTRGPSVTRYEVELEKGVRLNKLTTVADDIALSLGASGVRIAAVTGKISVVGIEVPNRAVTMVSLREVIDSSEFAAAKSKSSFAVGKDIGGSCIVGNIAKLPHMLIAGTTGSGKSVCMNSIIISLLYKASPDDVKLIMVDPKMVELGIYNGIPHLLIPVVTDPKKAAGSLQWAVTEMMRRYKAMSDTGVRDLESYNSIMEAEEGNKLPQVVVIIDELADLMLVAAKEVEESICRIAQMGRAAGIHLIIATQRPSADVITGLMKANIPSRIAFSVASAMESRIILDTQGAEKLVGRGDMLFAPIGCGKPLRVQGCFVSDGEVEAVANYVKNNYVNDYDQTVMEEIERKAVQTGNKSAATSEAEPTSEEMSGDEMLPAAVDVILETGQASVSMLQRRLKLGYARAARIVDEMEEKGIVGPFQGSKPRAILITKEKWAAMKAGGNEEPPADDFPVDEGVPEDFD